MFLNSDKSWQHSGKTQENPVAVGDLGSHVLPKQQSSIKRTRLPAPLALEQQCSSQKVAAIKFTRQRCAFFARVDLKLGQATVKNKTRSPSRTFSKWQQQAGACHAGACRFVAQRLIANPTQRNELRSLVTQPLAKSRGEIVKPKLWVKALLPYPPNDLLKTDQTGGGVSGA